MRLSFLFRLLCILSIELDCGEYGAVNVTLTFSSCHSVVVNLLVNEPDLSLWNWCGRPWVGMNWVNSMCAVVSALSESVGYSSTYLLKLHMTVRMYLHPDGL